VSYNYDNSVNNENYFKNTISFNYEVIEYTEEDHDNYLNAW